MRKENKSIDVTHGAQALQDFNGPGLTGKVNEHLRRRIFITIAFIVICFFHVWRISEIPRGFYCDELSIGYNALLVAHTGHDEHGQFLPVYFKAFGDYKNPLFVYGAALIFKLFGISETALRATSFTFYLLFLVGIFFLVERIFKSNNTISFYLLIAAGFLPWFFTLSRIAFEVISQLAVTTWALFFIYTTYYGTEGKKRLIHAFFAGLFLGVSIYSYSTARLLSFLMFGSVAVIYLWSFRKTIVLATGFAVALIPYVVFAIAQPGALTKRFGTISYIFDSTLSLWDKASIFARSYLSYFGLDFLLLRGDSNLRHATGYGGQVFFVVFALFVTGLIWLVIRRSLFKDKFQLLLLLNMLFSPVAASFTGKGTGLAVHSLRSILLGLFVLLFSCHGMAAIQSLKNKRLKGVLAFIVFAGIILQASLYVNYYYSEYKDVSIRSFQTYDFKDTLALAIEKRPAQIVIANWMNQAYILPSFYLNIVANPDHIPVYLADRFTPVRDTCFVYPAETAFIWDFLDKYYPDFYDFGFAKSLIRIRCY
jgi:hypothetical protein